MNKNSGLTLLVLFTALMGFFPANAQAKTAKEIDVSADVALDRLVQNVPSARDLLSRAKGVLVFPDMLKGGLGLGAEYGEGVLRVDGKTVDYYNMIGGSFGFQWGAQMRRIYVLFMDQTALDRFRHDSGWAGMANASAAIISVGAEGSIDTIKTNKPIITFVLDQKGLMLNLNLGVEKFNRIVKP